MLNITLLGTGGGMPMPNRHLSSTIINYKGRQILIDCGEGTQVSMRKVGSGFKSIDIICITHYHRYHMHHPLPWGSYLWTTWTAFNYRK